jgi:hypothetical protein
MALTVIKGSGGGTGSSFPGTYPPMYVNSNTISSNYTVASGTSAVSVGPVNIANGVSVTVATGSKWVIL